MKALNTFFTISVLFVSFAVAALSNSQRIISIVQNPIAAKPDDTYNDTDFNQYRYEEVKFGYNFDFDILKSNKKLWKLNINKAGFKLSDVSSKRNLLTVVNDPLIKRKLSLFKIIDGYFKNHYIEFSQFSDGSNGTTLKTYEYAMYEGKKSELQDKTLSYPLYTWLMGHGR